ncbi:coiled-coil domain-containing protein 14 isoform X2 [Betta splendens]|uniref:Coiled-coil domain-containing protein 14 isoform X2 n=1 Tax=Betta splendens TaxID=158456 RepID=A0A9W2XMK1_BETSP|nr:coiled-coil domain-containing protein 14 isoform X2 [Betta splendens]
MKGAARRKVVTSGRLTGGAKVQMGRKPVASNPAPAATLEPAYSLYSTDSEDQVTTLHKGLDRCAALLSGILQAEATATQSFPKAATAGVAKSKTSTSLGKRSIKKLPIKAAVLVKSCQAGQCGPRTLTPKPSHHSPAPAAHTGVKLPSPRKRLHRQLQSHHARPPSSKTLSPTNPLPKTQSQPSVLLSVVQSSSQLSPLSEQDSVRPCNAECDFVPVRDTNAQSRGSSPHMQSCTIRMSDMQLEPGHGDKLSQDGDDQRNCSTEKEAKVKTIQYLLEELKTLIAGQGNAAEMLLGYLEQAVFLPQVNDGSPTIQAGPELSSAHSQNTQLRRCMRTLEQQLKEKAETQQNAETLCNSDALQEELSTAHSRLQRLQDDLVELRQALQDTQRRLSVSEEENRALKTELETGSSRLMESERERSELAALAQQRLEEIENLNRILQSREALNCATVAPSLSGTCLTAQQQHRQHPARPLTDHIAQYLMSLEQLDPTEHVQLAPEREGSAEGVRRRLSDLMPSHLDVESVQCDWSVRSESTFHTKDEAAFRDGLAALDASIASLQKTIQLDLRR